MKGEAPLITGVAIAFLFLPGQADAADSNSKGVERIEDPISKNTSGDGVYGRFNGDLSLRLGLGIEADFDSSKVRPLVQGTAMFYETIGPYASFRQSVNSSDPLERVLSVGAQLQPLFIWRWSEDAMMGSAYADLILDSIGVAAGAHFTQPNEGGFAEQIGFEWGVVFGIPLLPQANGPWLRSRVSWNSGRGALPDLSATNTSLWLFLEWQGFFTTGVLE